MEQVVSLYAQRVSARIRAQQQVVGHVRVWACPRLVFSRIMPTRSCAIAPMKLRTARPIGVDGSTFNADSVRLWIAPQLEQGLDREHFSAGDPVERAHH